MFPPSAPSSPPGAAQTVYFSFFGAFATGTPQLDVAPLPLTASSVPTTINSSAGNGLSEANAMHFDSSGRLWIMNQPGGVNPVGYISAFAVPLTQASVPLLTLALTGTSNPDDFAFDSAGNLWVVSLANNNILEYAGPFTANATLVPVKTLAPGFRPNALAFDASGALYVSNGNSSAGTNAIAIFRQPFTNAPAGYLNGPTFPGGMAFDAAGNLYASSNSNSSGPTNAIVRYNSSNLVNGATPNISDPTGIASSPYGAALTFDRAGNLYDADCGNTAAVYIYPTATTAFSATLAPSVYRDASVTAAGCVWGIAIR